MSSLESQYPWYSDVAPDAPLEQGDIIARCNVIIPDQGHYKAIIGESIEGDDAPRVDVIEITAIIVSQSCDILNSKIDSVIVCPVWPLKDLVKTGDYFASKKGREDLRQGKIPSFHLLNKFELTDIADDFYFVDFKNIYSVPKSFLITLVRDSQRKRLLPPYREHLAQSFARYFMRVGLPTDINFEQIKNYSVKDA